MEWFLTKFTPLSLLVIFVVIPFFQGLSAGAFEATSSLKQTGIYKTDANAIDELGKSAMQVSPELKMINNTLTK